MAPRLPRLRAEVQQWPWGSDRLCPTSKRGPGAMTTPPAVFARQLATRSEGRARADPYASPSHHQIQVERIVLPLAQSDEVAAAFERTHELDALRRAALQIVPRIERIITRRQASHCETSVPIRRRTTI